MLSEDKITEIYCMADDFCKFFDETVKKHSFQVSDGKRHRNKPNRMSNAEVITILVAFHMSGHRCLKHFYLNHVRGHWGHLFPKTVSYNRFVELEREVALPLLVFVKQVLLGKCTGVNFVDSTSMRCKVVFQPVCPKSVGFKDAMQN